MQGIGYSIKRVADYMGSHCRACGVKGRFVRDKDSGDCATGVVPHACDTHTHAARWGGLGDEALFRAALAALILE